MLIWNNCFLDQPQTKKKEKPFWLNQKLVPEARILASEPEAKAGVQFKTSFMQAVS